MRTTNTGADARGIYFVVNSGGQKKEQITKFNAFFFEFDDLPLEQHESPEIETHVRIAEHDGKIYLDLCDKGWRQVEITEEGWRLIESIDSPVRFRRAGGMLALPLQRR